jgi:hypothetical protein
VAVSPQDGTSYEALLTAADRRMYEDKARHGPTWPAEHVVPLSTAS